MIIAHLSLGYSMICLCRSGEEEERWRLDGHGALLPKITGGIRAET